MAVHQNENRRSGKRPDDLGKTDPVKSRALDDPDLAPATRGRQGITSTPILPFDSIGVTREDRFEPIGKKPVGERRSSSWAPTGIHQTPHDSGQAIIWTNDSDTPKRGKEVIVEPCADTG